MIRCSPRCVSYLRDAVVSLSDSAVRVAEALDRSGRARAGNRAAGIHPHAAGDAQLRAAVGAVGLPLRFAMTPRVFASRIAVSARVRSGLAAGYGTPGLPLDRKLTASKLGFRRRCAGTRDVCAAFARQGRSADPVRDALLMQDLGRLAADVLLFYTQEFAFVSLPDAFTTGSSIMPQKRESGCVRADSRPAPPRRWRVSTKRSASARSCLPAISATCSCSRCRYSAASTSPRQTLDILPPAIDAMKFRAGEHHARPGDSRGGRSECAGW